METMTKKSASGEQQINKLLKNQTFRFMVTLSGMIALLGVALGAILKL